MKRSPAGRRHPSRPFVFLSHGSQDLWVAQQIAHHLRKAGATLFLDAETIEAGGKVDSLILKALNTMDEFVVLLTPWSMTRPYVWSELGVAWSREVNIIGLLYGISKEELQSRPEVPHFLKATSLKNLNEADAFLASFARRWKRNSAP